MMDQPLADVIDLAREHLEHNRRTQGQQEIKQRPYKPAPTGPKVIYRQADDSWF